MAAALRPRCPAAADGPGGIANQLREELVRARGRAYAATAAGYWRAIWGLRVPAALPELSTKRLLTMTWARWRPNPRNREGADRGGQGGAPDVSGVVRAVLPLRGESAGDPHLGNYTVAPDATVQPSRFRLRGVLPHFIHAGRHRSLSRAGERGDTPIAVHAYQSWGFGDLSAGNDRGAGPLGALCLRPDARRSRRLIQEKANGAPNGAANGADGAAVVKSVRRDIRRLSGVRPPREFVFMDRAAVGLGSVFMHLKAEMELAPPVPAS